MTLTKITQYQSDYDNRNPHRSAGFTIVEIVVVIVIIGTLAVIGFPALSKWVPNYQLKAATQVLYANFQKAKLHAVKTNNDVTFSFTFLADCSGPTGYTFTDDDGVVVAGETMKNEVCIYDSSFDNIVPLTSGFDPRGLPTGTLGAVKLKHTKISREYEITQSLAGNVRIK